MPDKKKTPLAPYDPLAGKRMIAEAKADALDGNEDCPVLGKDAAPIDKDHQMVGWSEFVPRIVDDELKPESEAGCVPVPARNKDEVSAAVQPPEMDLE